MTKQYTTEELVGFVQKAFWGFESERCVGLAESAEVHAEMEAVIAALRSAGGRSSAEPGADQVADLKRRLSELQGGQYRLLDRSKPGMVFVSRDAWVKAFTGIDLP